MKWVLAVCPVKHSVNTCWGTIIYLLTGMTEADGENIQIKHTWKVY